MVEKSRVCTLLTTALLASLFVLSAHSQAIPVSTDFPGQVRLVLPKAIYAVDNVETNIFFDNVILTTNSRNYVFDVVCEKGSLYEDRWSYTPASGEKGAFPLTVEVRDEANKVVARAHSTLYIANSSADADVPVTLLAVGDSLTEASIYTERLLELANAADGPSLKLVGSRGPNNSPARGANRHEGYSGWTAEAFATRNGPLSRSGYFRGEKTGSPFLYVEDGKNKLDFGRYCAQFNDNKPPDFVTFALGTNDIFRGTDETIDSITDEVLTYFDQLINMVHEYSASTKIGILLVIPPSASQDGFRNYKGSERQTRWQYRRNQHRFVERLIAHYGGRESENIYLVPAYLSIDAEHDFAKRPSVWSAENPEEVDRVIDGIHPAPAGYGEMAAAIYSWMKVCLSH